MRNRRVGESVEECRPIKISNLLHVWDILQSGLVFDADGHHGNARAFGDTAWNRMLRGYPIDRNAKRTIQPPSTDGILRDDDIRRMAGLNFGKHEGTGEYLCITLPNEVSIRGRLTRIKGQWTITGQCATMVANELTRDFKQKFLKYICRHFEVNVLHVKKHITTNPMLEVIDSFMYRYGIPDSPDHAERNQLKRYLYRWCKEDILSLEDEIEHLNSPLDDK